MKPPKQTPIDTAPRTAPATTESPIAREGGSYLVKEDGKLERQEFTRDPGHPDHEDNRKAAAAAKKEA